MTPVPWYQSLKFRSYVGGWLSLIIGWLIENISTHRFDFEVWTWIAVTISSLTMLGAAVKDWANPNVIAPFAFLNTKNVQTVSDASIQDAQKP